MISNDGSFEDVDPAKYPTPAPGTGQTSVTVGIDPSDDDAPASTPRSWGSLSLPAKVFTIVIGLGVSVAVIYGIAAFISARFFHAS